MRKLGNDIQLALADLSGDAEQARINLRANQVRSRYRQVIEEVYRTSAELFLAHTNNVYIMDKQGVRTLIVYVDESIFAAELNAQRELIKLKLLQSFGENIEEFEIYVSRGNYKQNHPYTLEASAQTQPATPPIPLDAPERTFVETTASNVDSPQVRKSFEKAMTASMELRKAEKGKSN